MYSKNILAKTINKYNKMSIPAKAGLWFTVSGFMQRGIAFISTPIFTRILNTEQYGIVSVFNTWEQLISILCTLNLFYGGFNNGMRDYKDRRDEYVSAVQGLITVITSGWVIVYLVAMPLWNQLLEMNTTIVCFMFLQVLASASLSLWAARERFEFRYKALVIIMVTNTLLGVVFPVIAILLSNHNNGAAARIIAHAVSVILICGGLYFYNLRKGKKFFLRDIWKSAFFFNLPLLPHYLSTMILNHSDRIMIGKMVGNSEAALYSVAYSAAMILNILSTSINHSFAPWIYGEIENKRYNNIAKVGNAMFAGLAVVLMMLIAFAPECILIFAGKKYHDAVMIVPSVAASLYFIFMYQIFANVEFYYKKRKFIAYASMIGAILNLILNYFGIKLFGYIAPGFATLICYIVFGVSHYIFMKRICKVELEGIRLFDAKTVFAIAVVLVSFSIIMMFLYPYTLIRYIILSVLIIAVFFSRKRIMHFVHILKKRS